MILHSRFLFRFFGAASVAVALSACSSEEAETADEKVYPMRGIVRAVEQEDGSVIIDHEDVPGYMPAMTMPFNVKDEALFETLQPGSAFAFDLVTTDDSSWIRNVRGISGDDLKLKERKPAIAGANEGRLPRLKEGDEVAPFVLVDQSGAEIDNSTFQGKDWLVTFIFTRCAVPDFCPQMSSHFAEVEKAILADPQLKSSVRLLSVSFDPEFDTPEILKGYAESYGASSEFWNFAVGTPKQTKELTSAFAVFTEHADGTINHGLTTAWIGPDGKVRQIWRGNAWKPADIVEALQSTIPTN